VTQGGEGGELGRRQRVPVLKGVRWTVTDAWRKRGRARGRHSGVTSGGSGPAPAPAGGAMPRNIGWRRGQRDAGQHG
jgi:hypothetical protein